MAIATVTKIGDFSYLYEWSGTSPFRVYRDGKQLFNGETTTETSLIVYTSDLYEPPILEVLDANDVYTPQTMLYPPFITLQWRGVTDASYYIVERSLGSANEVQTVTVSDGHSVASGVQTVTIADGDGTDTFQLAFDSELTEELDWDASAATVEAALEALSTIGTGNVDVALDGLVYTITFQGTLADMYVPPISAYMLGCTATVAVVTEGTDVDDSFVLTYDGEDTASLDWDSAAATVQSALEGLSTIGAGNVAVSLSSLVYTITFQGDLANTDVETLTSTDTDCLTVIDVVTEGYSDSWVEVLDGKIPESGNGYYKYEATADVYSNSRSYYPDAVALLDDVTSHSFRITPYDENDYAGTLLQFDVFLVRSPSAPEVTFTYGGEFLDASNWTSVDWTGTWAAGWTHTTGNTTALSQSNAAVIGATYIITFTVTGRTAGTFTVGFGGETSAAKSATGTYSPEASTTGGLIITPTTDFDGKIVITMVSNLLTVSARV